MQIQTNACSPFFYPNLYPVAAFRFTRDYSEKGKRYWNILSFSPSDGVRERELHNRKKGYGCCTRDQDVWSLSLCLFSLFRLLSILCIRLILSFPASARDQQGEKERYSAFKKAVVRCMSRENRKQLGMNRKSRGKKLIQKRGTHVSSSFQERKESKCSCKSEFSYIQKCSEADLDKRIGLGKSK